MVIVCARAWYSESQMEPTCPAWKRVKDGPGEADEAVDVHPVVDSMAVGNKGTTA